MRFLWPAQRYDRLTRESIVLAVAMTAISTVAICIPVVTIYRATEPDNSPVSEQAGEIVTFVRPPKPQADKTPTVSNEPRARISVPTRPPIERPLMADTSSLTREVAEAVAGDATRESAGGNVAPAPVRVGPFAVPDQLSWVKTLSKAARDSLHGPPLDLSTPLPPTPAQRDSAGRENDRLAAAAREGHRPMAIPLGGASAPFTFLSPGKSREERHRDSVVHADNLLRLARLAERARLRRDSVLAASALAGSPKDGRADSTRLRRPEPQPNDSPTRI